MEMINKQLIINGLDINAGFYKTDINDIFIPLLEKLKALQKKLDRRIVCFIAAPPGAGKSTLVSYLESLSLKKAALEPVQALSIDGFHYPNEYLKKHHIDSDLTKPLLMTIKGAKETYDVYKLEKLLSNIQDDNLIFPLYSRITHDVSDVGVLIDKKIILLEGNYLLLNSKPWSNLIKYADYSIYIKASNIMLKDNLIKRKIDGGAKKEVAASHYLNVDSKNINDVEKNSIKADLTLRINEDKHYQIIY